MITIALMVNTLTMAVERDSRTWINNTALALFSLGSCTADFCCPCLLLSFDERH